MSPRYTNAVPRRKVDFFQLLSRVDFFCAASVPGGDTLIVYDTVVHVCTGKKRPESRTHIYCRQSLSSVISILLSTSHCYCLVIVVVFGIFAARSTDPRASLRLSLSLSVVCLCCLLCGRSGLNLGTQSGSVFPGPARPVPAPPLPSRSPLLPLPLPLRAWFPRCLLAALPPSVFLSKCGHSQHVSWCFVGTSICASVHLQIQLATRIYEV